MANLQDDYREDRSYVNIHGEDLRVLTCGKTGSILIPLEELTKMGFSIYKKSQYNRLLVDDHEYTRDFYLYMLQCAQNYMLKNKTVFKENDVLESINNCKKLLTGGLNEIKKQPVSTPFFQNHVVQQNNDENITITSGFRQSVPMTEKNVNLFNEQKSKLNTRHSIDSVMAEGTRKGKNFSFEDNDNGFNFRKPHNSFEVKSNSSSSSIELNKPKNIEQNKAKNFSPIDSSSPKNKGEFKRPSLNARNNLKQDNKSDEEPKNQIKFQSFNKPEHTVVVTFVESPTIAWVQDVDNAPVLLKISKMIQEEVLNATVPSKADFQTVYLAQDEGEWYRCKPIGFKPALTVTFLDYGNTAQVTLNDLREVSKELAQFPAQAIRVTFEDSNFTATCYETITIKPITRKERGTYLVKVLQKDDNLPEEAPAPKSTQQEKPKPEVRPFSPVMVPMKRELRQPKSHSFFHKPQPLGSLKDGEKVMVIGQTDGKLVVRTRESYEKLKQIDTALEALNTESLTEKPKKEQLVMVQKGGKCYRGEVIGVEGASVEVELLDYPERLKIDLSSIKNITESLSQELVTYLITPPLKDYSGTTEAKKFLEDIVEKHTKAIVILNGGESDLKIGNLLMSDRLRELDNVSDRVMLKDMPVYKPKLGACNVMLYACRGKDNVTLVSEEEIGKYIDSIVKTDLDDDEPYEPLVGEVCLGDYQNSWSRCVNLRPMNGRFEVKFIDFGNVEFLTKDKLRKLTDDMKVAPVLGVQCKFVGLPSVGGIDQKLQELIKNEEERYDVIVKKFDGSVYEIEAPEIYKML